jgi:hypothetical protein
MRRGTEIKGMVSAATIVVIYEALTGQIANLVVLFLWLMDTKISCQTHDLPVLISVRLCIGA